MRVLHIVDAGAWRCEGPRVIPDGSADDAASLCGRLLARADRHEHRCLVLGPASFARRARALGLDAEWSTCPPLGHSLLAWPAIRRAAAACAPEAVCAWGGAAERAATAALGRGMPVVRIRLEGDATPPNRRAAPRREVVDVPSLPIPPARTPGGDRAAVRAELELRDSDVAVLLLGNRADASAMRFEFALGLSRHTGTRVVGVLPAWADSFARARDFQRKLEHTVRLASFSRPRSEVLCAVDLAAWTGGGRSATWPAEGSPSPLHIAECLAAGVPVVAPARMGTDELFAPEAREQCLAEVANPPEVARRLIPLVEDADLRQRISAACRRWRQGKDGLDDFASRVAEALARVTHAGGWAEVVASQASLAPGAARGGAGAA